MPVLIREWYFCSVVYGASRLMVTVYILYCSSPQGSNCSFYMLATCTELESCLHGSGYCLLILQLTLGGLQSVPICATPKLLISFLQTSPTQIDDIVLVNYSNRYCRASTSATMRGSGWVITSLDHLTRVGGGARKCCGTWGRGTQVLCVEG